MNNTIWTDEELFDSAKAYLEMLRKEEAGEKYVKKDYYRKLSHKHGRTEKSFEYRMQNISYVRFLLGRIWLDGLKPAKNVGTKNTARIESILLKLEGGTATPQAVFEFSVRESLQKKEIALPIGNSHPARIPTTISQIQRDAQVKAWVLQNANGICECCDTEAPFCSADGLPYLEVHHILGLADGGSDTVLNTVALCPNCHREIHYGINAARLRTFLYQKIDRLTRQ